MSMAKADEYACKNRIEQVKRSYDFAMERAVRLEKMRQQSLSEASMIGYKLMRLDRQRYNTFGGEPPGYYDRLAVIAGEILNPPKRLCNCSCCCYDD